LYRGHGDDPGSNQPGGPRGQVPSRVHRRHRRPDLPGRPMCPGGVL